MSEEKKLGGISYLFWTAIIMCICGGIAIDVFSMRYTGFILISISIFIILLLILYATGKPKKNEP